VEEERSIWYQGVEGAFSTIFQRIGEEGGMGWDLAHVMIDLVDSFNHPTSLAL
jgi:hypothetical protein